MSLPTIWERRGLRIAVVAIAALEVALLGALVLLFLSQAGSSDPLSRAIGVAVAGLLAVPLVVLALPALVLAVAGRWLKVALALSLLAVPATAIIYFLM